MRSSDDQACVVTLLYCKQPAALLASFHHNSTACSQHTPACHYHHHFNFNQMPPPPWQVLERAFQCFPRHVLATCWSACQGTDADLLRGALLLLREQLAPVRQSLEDEALRPTSLAASVLGGHEEARGWLTDTLARHKGG